jgi:prepilin-type processing-associated H-X9-DG protein
MSTHCIPEPIGGLLVYLFMATLDYIKARPRKPYHYRYLIIACCAFAIAFTDYLLALYTSPGFPGTPLLIRLSGICSLIASALAILAGIIALVTIAFRFRSIHQLVSTSIFALLFMLGTPFLWFLSEDQTRMTYHHPAYLRHMASARSVVQSVNLFAADHAGRFPPHLASLILSEQVTPKELSDVHLAPYAPPEPLPPETDWPAIAADVDAHSIFIYTGADLVDPTFMSLDPAIIILYTQPLPCTPGHRIVAFADGHAELIPESDLPKFFDVSNAARAKLRLPAFTLDGPPPHQ